LIFLLICIGDTERARTTAETSSGFSFFKLASVFFFGTTILLDRNSHDSLFPQLISCRSLPEKKNRFLSSSLQVPTFRSARDFACHMECLNFSTPSPLLEPVTQALSKRVLLNDLARSTKGRDLTSVRLSRDFPATSPMPWIRGLRRMLNRTASLLVAVMHV
jgi:hypothetical protein